MAQQLIYVKSETHTRIKALAHLDGRPMVNYLDRLLRSEVSKIDTTRYNRAVETVTERRGLDVKDG